MSDDNANIIQPFSDEYFMKAAFQQAISAFEKKEVPVGVVIVSKKQNHCPRPQLDRATWRCHRPCRNAGNYSSRQSFRR